MTEVKSVSTARLAGTALYVMAWPALLFILAGDARWTEGWLFTGWLIGLYTTLTMATKNIDGKCVPGFCH
jgi:hypothetical protein